MPDKYFIMIDTPEQSLAVQVRLIDNGIVWVDGDATPTLFHREVLCITHNDRFIACSIGLFKKCYEGMDLIELSASEIIQSGKHPLECTVSKKDKVHIGNIPDITVSYYEEHPSEWKELPDGVVPIKYESGGEIYRPRNPKSRTWKESPYWFNFYAVNSLGVIIGSLMDEGFDSVPYLTMVEFSNGWIWESAGKGWRKKDTTMPCTLCGSGDGFVCHECATAPYDNDCIHCDDDGCAGMEEPNIHEIIGRTCDPYGKNDHPALMQAHNERQRPEKWSIEQDNAAKIVSATKNIMRLHVGDERTDGAQEEK